MSDPVPSSCIKILSTGPCRRKLSSIDRERWDRPDLEPDHCGFCLVPLTDRAKDKRRLPGIATKAVAVLG